MKRFFQLVLCLYVGMMLLSSCTLFDSREVTVSSRRPDVQQIRTYYRNELINYDGLMLESENFLHGNLMQDNLANDPLTILNELNEYYRIAQNPKYLLIAADMCRYLASKSKDTKAIQYSLSSLYYTTKFTRANTFFMQGPQKHMVESWVMCNFPYIQAVQDYNEACSGIFLFLKNHNLIGKTNFALFDVEGHKYIFENPVYNLSVPPENVEEFSLCAAYDVKNLTQINRRPGMGTPLVARITPKKIGDMLFMPQGLTIPVTLLIKRQDMPNGDIKIQPIFIDATKQENFSVELEAFQKTFQAAMALDFSTPLACFLSDLKSRNLLGQMLNPFAQEASDGMYFIEPYQPNKIPVVFIHGLMSSPETWVQMINSLKNDPTIRRRYQFWFFSYSTGAPVLYSAMKLRKALQSAQKEFCTTPEATANFNKMVLVGHSMGGMLTRLMVQDDPNYIAEHITSMITGIDWTLEKIEDTLKSDPNVKPEDIQYFNNILKSPTMPFVSRTIFMAVPHKGAEMAKTPIARLGIRLIKLPTSLLNKQAILDRVLNALMKNKRQKYAQMLKVKFYTGIDNLDPDNKFVHAIGSSPIKKDLPFHCIIGNNKEAKIPDGSDGVVPYWSSHLNNASSELVVKSDHSVHRRPAAIQEVLRILLLHLKAVENKDTNE